MKITIVAFILLLYSQVQAADFYRVFYKVDYYDETTKRLTSTIAKCNVRNKKDAEAFVTKSQADDSGFVVAGDIEGRKYSLIVVAPGETFDPKLLQ